MVVEAARGHRPAATREARPRLEARLRRALSARLTLVVAAPGYGKTVTLARLAELDPRPPLWHTCSPGEPGATLIGELAASIAGDPRPRLVLIDAIQYLAPQELDSLMHYITHRLPPGSYAALASTVDHQQADLVRLLAEGDAAYVDERDLAFDRAEARAVAQQLGRTDADADEAWARACGWPLGVVTILDRREAWLGDYFRFSTLERLAPRLRQFVETTLVLERLTEDACHAVFRSSDATQLLVQATTTHVFLRRISGGSPEFLPLFRTTVLEALRRDDPRRVARSSDRAAQHLLQEGDARAALRVAVAGSGWTGGLNLLRRIGTEAVAAGRGAELAEWIAIFPVEVAHREPWLQYFKGVAVRLDGDYPSAVLLQEQARDGFQAADVQEGYAYALAELGTLACLLDRPAEAEQLLGEARVALGTSDDVHQAAVLCSLADAYVALNRLREANAAGEEAAALTASDATSPIASVHVQALQRIALVRMREGRFTSAMEAVLRALELGHDHPLDAETNAASSLMLALVRWGLGELESAEEVLSQSSRVTARLGLTRLKSTVDAAHATVLADLGRLDEADRLFATNDASAEVLGVNRQAGMGVLRLLQGRFLEARAIFRELLEAASIAGSAADVARAKASLGVVALRTNRLSEAEQWLLDAARGLEQSGSRYRLAGTHLHLADLYLAGNDTLRCKRYLKSALDYAAAAQSYHFFLWHPATMGRVAAFALREGVQPAYVEAFCVRRLGATEVHAFLPLLAERNARVQEAARRIIDAVLPREGPLALAGLESCNDEAVRIRLTRALVEGCLTARGVLLLRHQYRLTWAETEVFVEYYLTELGAASANLEPERRALARRLAISENTLRHHITSIRQKLGLASGRGTASVFIWALTTGIATWPPKAPRQ